MDGNGTYLTLTPRNSSFLNQTSYIGAISSAGAANYASRIVIGQQVGASTFTERVRIDSNGNVGIGTTTPGSTLEVVGLITTSSVLAAGASSGDTGHVRLSNSNGAGTSSVIFEGSSQKAYIRSGFTTGATDAYLSLATRGSNTLSEKVRIDSNGNVGIGTTSPTAPLQIKQQIAGAGLIIEDYASPTTSGLSVDSATGLNLVRGGSSARLHTSNGIDLYTTNAPRLKIDSSGNVGIGTTAPAASIDIVGRARVSQAYEIISANVLVSSPAVNSLGITTAGAERIRVDSAGNVGIGTSAPGEMLSVYNPAAASTSFAIKTLNSYKAGMTVTEASNLWIFNGGGTRMTIDASGAVGIGNTSPGVALDVIGSMRSTGNAVVDAGSGTVAAYLVLNGRNASTQNPVFISSSSAGDLRVQPQISRSTLIYDGSATERMRIDSSGNVGIGTSNPLAMLDVNGNINANGYFRQGNANVLTRNSGVTNILSGSGIGLMPNNSTTALFAEAAGNVGIGTTAPTQPLDIALANALIVGAPAGGSDKSGRIFFRRPADGNPNAQLGYTLTGTGSIFGLEDTSGNGEMRMRAVGSSGAFFSIYTNPGGTGAVEAMRIASSGNVGIGTTSPGSKLEVAGSILLNDSFAKLGVGEAFPQDQVHVTGYNPAVRLQSIEAPSAANSIPLNFWFLNNAYSKKSFAQIKALSSSTTNSSEAGALSFSTTQASTLTEKVRIESTGNVGIGTTAPSAALHVVGLTNPAIRVDSGAASYVAAVATANGAYSNVSLTNDTVWRNFGNMVFANANTNNDFIFTSGAANADTEKLRIKNSGNVGIGTTAPGSKLEVQGGVKIESTSNQLVLYRDSTDYVYFAVDGSGNLTIDNVPSAGVIRLNSETRVSDALIQTNGSAISSFASNVGIGTTSPNERLEIVGDGAAGRISTVVYDAANIPQSKFGKARNTLASPAIVNNGDTLMQLQADGFDESSFRKAARIEVQVDGIPGASDMPGRIVFSTSADGTNSTTERMRINSSGNVGIGTTTPAQALDVAGTALVQQLSVQGLNGTILNGIGIRNSSATTGTGSRIAFANGGGGGTPMVWIGNEVETTTTDSSLTFATRQSSGNPSEKMRLTGVGNVGIGTTAPSSVLAFSGDSSQKIAMEKATVANSAGNGLTVQAGGATSGSTDKAGGFLSLSGGISSGTGSSQITFATASAASTGTGNNAPTIKMVVEGSGNVGIGTTSPSSPLNVVGAINTGSVSINNGGTLANNTGFSVGNGNTTTNAYSAGQNALTTGVFTPEARAVMP